MWMRNLGTKRHTWTTIKSVCKESNGEDVQPNRNQGWRFSVRTNEEIVLLIKHADTGRYIKAQGIRWVGHTVRMNKERIVKRVTE